MPYSHFGPRNRRPVPLVVRLSKNEREYTFPLQPNELSHIHPTRLRSSVGVCVERIKDRELVISLRLTTNVPPALSALFTLHRGLTPGSTFFVYCNECRPRRSI